ncbi:DUF3630 family protein [Shewanella sp. 3B26]|uniref:DUF3630 family protein n=1 Tax=Shewanella zhuhaiensis TaxID=2919576 RepID=A0AAJ1BIE6_9GAMM|nr:DUF3630 family protein [Shewanella zhuhaiensis]MCH4295350.1 DUF3630 family protein [Shewanella zhuhaiensis]
MNIQHISLDKEAISLAVRGDIDFDRFDEFAEPLAAALDCRVLERQWGADRHQWLLDFEGCRLWLNFEFYGDVAWLASDREEDLEVLAFLAGLLAPLVQGDAQ